MHNKVYDASTDLDAETARSLIGAVVTITVTDKLGTPPSEITGKVSVLATEGSSFVVFFEHGPVTPSLVDLEENTVTIERDGLIIIERD